MPEEACQIPSANSDVFSVVGLHYYFSLPSDGEIHAQIKPYYYSAGEKKDLPKNWLDKNEKLHLLLNDELDYGFIPKLHHGTGEVIYNNSAYRLALKITPEEGSEVSFQIYHPNDAKFVCIEPISATNPRGDLPKSGALIVDFMITCLAICGFVKWGLIFVCLLACGRVCCRLMLSPL